MAFTLLSLAMAFLIRVPALYVALTRVGYFRISKSTLILVALFSTFLGVIMPAGFLDIVGVLFRVVLLSIILMILLRGELMDSLKSVAVAAFLESIMILALSLSPFSFLVAGLGVLSVP